MKRRLSEEVSSIKVFQWSDIHKRRKISQGGQGHIFEAELKHEGRTVAIKEIMTDSDDDDNDSQIFCHEARMMAKLHHPNIISFHGVAADSIDVDHGNVHDLHDLVIEFMPNGDLEHVIDADEDFVILPWRSRVMVATQVAEAVEYMHSMDIIHFDIKSSNVLLDLSDPTRPLCKICDLGHAMEKEDDMSFMHGAGTMGRMAPEMSFIKCKITEKVDVYSFGVLMSELLTGMAFPHVDMISNDDQVNYTFFGDWRHHEAVPEWCFHKWRGLMRDCLTCEAPRRPAFSEVAARLRDMLAALDPLPLETTSESQIFTQCEMLDTRPTGENLSFEKTIQCEMPDTHPTSQNLSVPVLSDAHIERRLKKEPNKSIFHSI